MDQLVEVTEGLRKKFMKSIFDYTDPGYNILKRKSIPLSKEEQEFTEIYEKMVCLHAISIMSLIPSTYYYFLFYRNAKKTPPNTKLLTWARRRFFILFPISMATVTVGYIYGLTHDFQNKLKEIQQFYLDHQNQDINTFSFPNKDVQNL